MEGFLPLEIGDRIIVLRECPASNRWLLTLYLGCLNQRFEQFQEGKDCFSLPWAQDLINEILRLCQPTRPLTYDDISHDPDVITELFIGDDSMILDLHKPTPIEQDSTEGSPLVTINNVPIESSGDPMADLMARLVCADSTVSGAISLADRYGMNFLQKFVQQVFEQGLGRLFVLRTSLHTYQTTFVLAAPIVMFPWLLQYPMNHRPHWIP
jgi:hypothetical protein